MWNWKPDVRDGGVTGALGAVGMALMRDITNGEIVGGKWEQ
jgi:hypothetical protein